MIIHPKINKIIEDIEICDSCGHAFKKDFIFCNNSPHEIMLIFEKPGSKDKNEEMEQKKAKTLGKKIEITQKYFNKWLNKTRLKRVVNEILKRLMPSEPVNNSKKELKEFTSKLYLTDVSKLRASKGCEKHIKQELELIKPKYVFAFGNKAWSFVKEFYSINNNKNISEIHGMVFQSKNDNVKILPLVHPSGKFTDIRDSYFSYMKKGLKEMCNC